MDQYRTVRHSHHEARVQHGQATAASSMSAAVYPMHATAGRLLVKLCIEVCVCFYRSPDPSKSVLIQQHRAEPRKHATPALKWLWQGSSIAQFAIQQNAALRTLTRDNTAWNCRSCRACCVLMHVYVSTGSWPFRASPAHAWRPQPSLAQSPA
jgi:hypothetical protein